MAQSVPLDKQEAPPNGIDDLVGPGVHRIAKHTPDSARRVRHLIDFHDFPCFKRGGRYYSRHSWIAAYYWGEDQA